MGRDNESAALPRLNFHLPPPLLLSLFLVVGAVFVGKLRKVAAAAFLYVCVSTRRRRRRRRLREQRARASREA